MSEIIKGRLYLGDIKACSNREWLKSKGITHILNTAKEVPNYFPKDFRYLNLDLDDHPSQTLSHILTQAYDYINGALNNRGVVLIHCYAGISRSASITIYYLMKKYNLDFKRAHDYVYNRRNIINPNQGFRAQLVRLSPNKLEKPWWENFIFCSIV